MSSARPMRERYDEDGKRIATDEEIAATHPDFTITCDKCGSKRVFVDSSVGYSALSGGWGSVDLECMDCKASTEIMEMY